MGNLDENTNWGNFPICPKCGYRYTDLDGYPEDEEVESECPDCESKLTIKKAIMARYETSIAKQERKQ